MQLLVLFGQLQIVFNMNKRILFFISSIISALIFYRAMTFDVELFLTQIRETRFYIHLMISIAFGITISYLIIRKNK